jgi:hypothetical protein
MQHACSSFISLGTLSISVTNFSFTVAAAALYVCTSIPLQSSTLLKIFEIYDYFLTIELEISLIWFSSWTYTKIIYLGARYLPIVSTFFLIRSTFLLSTALEGYELRLTTTDQLFFDAQDCRRSYILATCMVDSQYPHCFEPHASQVFPGLVCFLQKVRAVTTCSNHY